MIPLEHFTVSLALSVIVAFVAGAGFGAWLSLRVFIRAQKQFRADQFYVDKPLTGAMVGNFKPRDTDEEIDPTKPPPFHIGGSMAEKPPTEVKLTVEEVDRLKEKLKQDNGPDTFERTPP